MLRYQTWDLEQRLELKQTARQRMKTQIDRPIGLKGGHHSSQIYIEYKVAYCPINKYLPSF